MSVHLIYLLHILFFFSNRDAKFVLNDRVDKDYLTNQDEA